MDLSNYGTEGCRFESCWVYFASGESDFNS
jgi:hypothetical protein